MQAPTVFHGRYREVGRAAKRIARQMTRGESLSALAPSWIDLRKATGLVLLEGPSVLVGGSEHYHASALTKALVEVRLGEDRSVWGKAWTQQAMQEPWSLLGLLGQYGQFLIQDEQLIDLLLRVVEYWDEFVAIGDRYSRGFGGQSFWSAASIVKAWLARMGVDVLRTPEPRAATELGDIVRACTGYRIQRCLAARLFEEAVAVLEQERHDVVFHAEAALFVAAGRPDLVAPIMRRASERADERGRMARYWLGTYGSADGGDPVKDTREAFLAGPCLDAWKRLKKAGGDAVAEDALAEILRQDKSVVVWVRVWDDDPRALQAWEHFWQRGVDRSLLEFAAAHVARVITNEAPAKAGELYLIAARKHVELRKPKAYRESASLVRKARDAYVTAGRPDLGSASIERFRSEYRRFRRLMEALDDEGL